MAVLTETERPGLWERPMREGSAERESSSLTRAELRAAIDGWRARSAVAFHRALPAAVRVTLTARRKARLFLPVARRRFEREV